MVAHAVRIVSSLRANAIQLTATALYNLECSGLHLAGTGGGHQHLVNRLAKLQQLHPSTLMSECKPFAMQTE